MDTIYAVATARGKSGVAIIRISGPDAGIALQGLGSDLPKPRVAVVRNLQHQGRFLDQALVLRFDKGASFTGEEVVELHTHGGMAVVSSVLDALSCQPGLRMAEAGEFTRRALENGTLDLAQVEGLADLIDAETEAQRVQALRVLSGAIGQKVDNWRRAIVRAGALIEATIDFADEDVPVDVTPEVTELLGGLLDSLGSEIKASHSAERIREGFEVAIVGLPNAGKSTLLNALAGREAAITSEIAGTTRDVIEVRMDIGGLAVTILDTAGLRETTERIELLGIELARRRAKQADLRVFLRTEGEIPGLVPQADDIIVQGKADIHQGDGLRVSGLTGEGVGALLDRIGSVLQGRVASAGLMTRERHRIALMTAMGPLESARGQIKEGFFLPELVAEELRQAARALEVLVGRVNAETLLDEIFASFCIGK